MHTARKTRRSRLGRILLRAAGGLALAGVFVMGCGVGLLLHLDFPAVRRQATVLVNQGLSGLFVGQVRLGTVQKISPGGVEVLDARVIDPGGQEVLRVNGLRARADLLGLVWQLVMDQGPRTILIDHVRVESAECRVLPNPKTGIPTLVDAFALRAPPDPARPAVPIEVRLPSIEIGQASGQGRFENLPLLEADVTRVAGSVIAREGQAEIDVRRFGARVRGIAGAVAQGTATLHVSVPGAVTGSFEGRLGEIGVAGKIRAEGRKVSAEINLPLAESEALKALWPDWPLHASISALLQASGTLPTLETSAELKVGQSTLAAHGPVRLTGDVGAHLELEAARLDLGAFVAGAPPTDIDSKGAITFLVRQGRTVATFEAATQPTVIQGHSVPSLDITGHVRPQGIDAAVTLHEPGMPIKVDIELESDGTLKVTAKSERFRLAQSRLRQLIAADGEAEFELGARLAKSQLDASFVSSFRQFSWGDIRIGQGRLSGHLRGPIAELDRATVEAELEASGVKAGLFALSHVNAEARGPILHPELKVDTADRRGLGLTLTAQLSARERRVDRMAFVVSRGETRLEGKVKTLDLGGGTIEVKELELAGAGGKLTGSARLRPDLVEVTVDGSELDLDVMSRTLGLPPGLYGGKVRVQADVAVGAEVSRGRLRLGVTNGSWAHHSGIDGDLSADLSKEHLSGNASLKIQGLGELGTRFTAGLGGDPLTLAAWERATGQVTLDFGRVDLEGLRKLLPQRFAAPTVTGSVGGWVNVERENPSALPNVVTQLTTRDLAWRYGDADDATLRGIELGLGATFDGETGKSQATVQVADIEGSLCAATAQTRVDLVALREHPENVAQQLAETPFQAAIDVPERSFAAFPEPVRLEEIEGRIGVRVVLDGKPTDPVASVQVLARGVKLKESRFEVALDVQGAAQYQSSSGRLTGTLALRSAERQVALFSWQAEAPWEALLLGGEPGQPTWRGEGWLTLTEFPLEAVPPLADARIGGFASGEMKLHRQALVPTFEAQLGLTQTTVRGVPLGTGKLRATSSGDVASVGLDLADGHGSLHAEVTAGTAWVDDFLVLDSKRAIEARVHATGFDAAGLMPLTEGVLTGLSGSVQADFAAELRPEPDPEHPGEIRYQTKISGQGSIERGMLEIAGLGLELRNVECGVQASNQGETTKIRVSDLKGSARSNKQNVTAWADLDLERGKIVRGRAGLGADQVPLPIEGVNVATARGRAELELERGPGAITVKAKVSELVAQLPRSSTRSVISLQDNRRVVVIQPLGEPREKSTSDGLPWIIEFDLGPKVRIERGDVYLPISGKPRLILKDKTELDGYVDLEPGGRLVAIGKLFRVESGRVWFDSVEPTNPRVSVTASWRGPEATIYIDVRGRWKSAQLSLRSDPPRPQPELLMVLLYGSTGDDGQAGAGKGQALLGAQTAASLLGLADVLAGTPLSGLEVRADTSQGKEAYAASVRVSDRVWVEGIYRRQTALGQTDGSSGQPDAGQTAAGSTKDAFAGAVDLRLGRDWTLRTEGGNASAAVDLLWQYRY